VKPKNHDRLRFLSLAAKVATDPQLYRATGIGQAQARRLSRRGVIRRRRVLVNSPKPLAAPVATFEFESGRECIAPDFRVLSRLLKARSLEPAVELFIVYASEMTEDLTGGVAARIKPLQLHHDLQVTEALIARGIPPGWRSEAFLARHRLAIGDFVPDAALVEDGKIVRAFEYGGFYGPGRVDACWRACYRTRTPLELW
jgi:hypothetical protein